MKTSSAILLLCLVAGTLSAQSATLKGKITDKEDSTEITGAGLTLKNLKDSLHIQRAATNLKGDFSFQGLAYGDYRLQVRYLGYKTLTIAVKVNRSETYLGTLKLEPDSGGVSEIEITAPIVPMKQNGDTVEYNANAYPTDPDAELEDLMARLPGITTFDGLKAQGEPIQQIFVDNRPYFGGDLDVALKNIPAETIDKIQVYYKQSDQAKFTGFDDGQSIKVINIITKPDKRNGQFGKAYAGYATGQRYNLNGDLNFFDGNRRITVMGASANTTPGNTGGINNTNTIGANYGDSLGHKVFLTGSYDFRNAINSSASSLTQTYFAAYPANEVYAENTAYSAFSAYHRFNFKMDCRLDSANILNIAPAFTINTGSNSGNTQAANSINSQVQSYTQNQSSGTNQGINGAINIMYGHRFHKKGRSLSLNFNASNSSQNANSGLNAYNSYPANHDSVSVFSQTMQNATHSINFAPSLSYTEPLGKNSGLQANYSFAYSHNDNSKMTYNDSTLPEYSKLDSQLTSAYNVTTLMHRGGLSYLFRSKKSTINLSLNYQDEGLNGSQQLSLQSIVNKNYGAFLPSLVFNYKFTPKTSVAISYQTQTALPSIFQLQEVVNNSNPLLLSTGNPDLVQQYTHTVGARLGFPVGPEASLSLNGAASAILHPIGSSVVTASHDSILPGGYLMHQGSQLTRPVNLDYGYNTRLNAAMAIPVKPLAGNFNINGGYALTSAPGLVNNITGFTNTSSFTGGLVLSGHTKSAFDYMLNYSPAYNIVKNTLVPQQNNNYLSQNISSRINYVIWKGFVFNTDFSYHIYSGLSSPYNQNYALWNASIGKKFFKKQNGELRLYVYDILDNQNNISHTVTALYVQDRTVNMLGRYYMASFVYHLRNYRK